MSFFGDIFDFAAPIVDFVEPEAGLVLDAIDAADSLASFGVEDAGSTILDAGTVSVPADIAAEMPVFSDVSQAFDLGEVVGDIPTPPAAAMDGSLFDAGVFSTLPPVDDSSFFGNVLTTLGSGIANVLGIGDAQAAITHTIGGQPMSAATSMVESVLSKIGGPFGAAVTSAGGAIVRGAAAAGGRLMSVILPNGTKVTAKAVAALARRIGIDAAAVGLGIGAVDIAQAILQDDKRRARSHRRGISWRDMNVTNRTMRKFHTMQRHLKCSPTRRRKSC